ncbi:methylenetetrahydrofolate reductase [Candidatus Berkelbacteria bacterium]|nr:methylenetetrahydrofolate reductase [Candidatus Berkelbacteria bacterium]MBI4029804.1 methylenetetrahydrofolate reductase [Candidatus Berkelbacteria bacterium]
MRLEEMYLKDPSQPRISVELIPSRTEEGRKNIVRSIEVLEPFNPAMFTVTYGLGGRTRDSTLNWVEQLSRLSQSEVMCHLSIVGQTKADLRQNLSRLEEMRVSNLIALRGDPLEGETRFVPFPGGFEHTVEFVSEIAAHSCFSVAVAGYPEIHPDAVGNRAADMDWLKRKVEAGGSVVYTQFFFDNAHFWRFREEAIKVGLKVPIVPGILPIRSKEWLLKRAGKYGVSLPKKVSERLSGIENDPKGMVNFGIELASEMCQGLLADSVPGLHFYCLNHGEGVAKVLSSIGFSQTHRHTQ